MRDEPNASYYSARYAERKRAAERARDEKGYAPSCCALCARVAAPMCLLCVRHDSALHSPVERDGTTTTQTREAFRAWQDGPGFRKPFPMPGFEERHPVVAGAAFQYADRLEFERNDGAYTVVLSSLRGWARVVRRWSSGPNAHHETTVAFIGLSSGGVYSVVSDRKYGKRLGSVFAFARGAS
jgi:hypothetical protein